MADMLRWLVNSPPGVAVLIIGMMVVFLVIAAITELKTKRNYPDQDKNGRGRKR